MLRSLLTKASIQYCSLINPVKNGVYIPVKTISQSCKLHGVLDKDNPHKKSTFTEKELPQGEEDIEFDPKITFPNKDTNSLLINGTRFDEIPIVHIKATSNNTIITATDHTGLSVAIDSGGTVGFRNAKKGTNIAAQAAAFALSQKILRKGMKIVRVSVRGIGPGRLPAIKGLQMSGVTVVSITDCTPIPFNGSRPRKVRRL